MLYIHLDLDLDLELDLDLNLKQHNIVYNEIFIIWWEWLDW